MRTSRRELLKGSANFTAALCLQQLLPAQNTSTGPVGLAAGIQLYTVRNSLRNDPAGTLKELHAIGYREVEAAGTASLSVTEFRRLLDASGLKCPSAHVNFTKDDFQSGFAQAKALGASFATSSILPSAIFPENQRSGQSTASSLTADQFHRLAEVMNQIGKAATGEGLKYAYHNHNIEFVRMADGGLGFDILLRETDAKNVVFEADCGWMAAAGADPSEYFAKFPDRFRMMHVKDFAPVAQPITNLSGPIRPRGVDLGQGFVDYKRIFAAARRTGIQHAFVEQEDPFPSSDMDSARADFKFMASIT